MAAKEKIVQQFQDEFGLNVRDAKELLDATVSSVVDVLVKHGRLELRDLGVFQVKTHAPHVAKKNPKVADSGTIVTGESTNVHFKVSKAFRSELKETGSENEE